MLDTDDEIGRVAVIGSGVMGAGVAAHCANAGCEVILLDIVCEGEEDRNSIPRKAIQDMLKADPEMLMHKSFAKRIIPGNLEDDLQKLEDCDWVIEAIVENLEIKRSVYQKISQYIGTNTIVSSNTSTLPRSSLIQGMPEEMESRFLITHFFNPPRYLPLLEVVSDSKVDGGLLSGLVDFADKRLGKRVIHCNDTPGFIGNRLGIFFIQRAL
ncbi:MAG: 3-hydroxyacyl-CoA dehydrogenase family protein, partial [Candidatus Thermoplasmatota archaeon]|nr:3-hydroxyacyl-CoA dehydrogenase family protein [Candidatus Thermoplasmatota archaeon]